MAFNEKAYFALDRKIDEAKERAYSISKEKRNEKNKHVHAHSLFAAKWSVAIEMDAKQHSIDSYNMK